MNSMPETSDALVLDLLRRRPQLTVTDLAEATGVTATAVRQRLVRLMAQGLVQRHALRGGRGRPSHTYSLTPLARQTSGTNFADLASILWKELRAIRDPAVRRGLIERLAKSLADQYRERVSGTTAEQRMQEVVELLSERKVPFAMDRAKKQGGLPVLMALECPYPELAEQDRGICAMEKILFAELVDPSLKLTECRLDGHRCCQFESN